MSDEALRALEKKWRTLAVIDNDGTRLICASELSALLTTRQEVAPVEPAWFYIRTPGADYDYSFTKTREEAIDLQDCDDPDEPIPLYTSTGQTSDARDGAVGYVSADGNAVWLTEGSFSLKPAAGTNLYTHPQYASGDAEVLTAHGIKALDRCCGELRKFIELAGDYDLDEMAVQALQTAIESMEMRKANAMQAKEAK